MSSEPDDDFDAFVRARWTGTARLAYALTLDHQKAEDLAQGGLHQALVPLAQAARR